MFKYLPFDERKDIRKIAEDNFGAVYPGIVSSICSTSESFHTFTTKSGCKIEEVFKVTQMTSLLSFISSSMMDNVVQTLGYVDSIFGQYLESLEDQHYLDISPAFRVLLSRHVRSKSLLSTSTQTSLPRLVAQSTLLERDPISTYLFTHVPLSSGNQSECWPCLTEYELENGAWSSVEVKIFHFMKTYFFDPFDLLVANNSGNFSNLSTSFSAIHSKFSFFSDYIPHVTASVIGSMQTFLRNAVAEVRLSPHQDAESDDGGSALRYFEANSAIDSDRFRILFEESFLKRTYWCLPRIEKLNDILQQALGAVRERQNHTAAEKRFDARKAFRYQIRKLLSRYILNDMMGTIPKVFTPDGLFMQVLKVRMDRFIEKPKSTQVTKTIESWRVQFSNIKRKIESGILGRVDSVIANLRTKFAESETCKNILYFCSRYHPLYSGVEIRVVDYFRNSHFFRGPILIGDPDRTTALPTPLDSSVWALINNSTNPDDNPTLWSLGLPMSYKLMLQSIQRKVSSASNPGVMAIMYALLKPPTVELPQDESFMGVVLDRLHVCRDTFEPQFWGNTFNFQSPTEWGHFVIILMTSFSLLSGFPVHLYVTPTQYIPFLYGQTRAKNNRCYAFITCAGGKLFPLAYQTDEQRSKFQSTKSRTAEYIPQIPSRPSLRQSELQSKKRSSEAPASSGSQKGKQQRRT
jgi:hypothetical protein